MYVNLVDQYLDTFPASYAWKVSRPSSNDEYVDIANIDLPFNEFVNVHLEIQSTLIEREIFATFRRHVMWAQTSRVQNPLAFEVISSSINPNVGENPDHYEASRGIMIDLCDMGVRQDDYRIYLPLVSLTTYSISTDIRTIIKIAGYFEYLSVYSVSFREQFLHFSRLLLKSINKFTTSNGIDTKNFKVDKILSEDYRHIGNEAKITNGVYIVDCEIPFHLRAQLVRHRNIGIRDNFFRMLKHENAHLFTMDIPMSVQFFGDREAIESVVSKRNCWLANYKVWKDLLDVINDSGNQILPCTGKDFCPYAGDAQLRIEGKDPNPPCPKHMRLHGIRASEEQKEEIAKMIVLDSRNLFWHDELRSLK